MSTKTVVNPPGNADRILSPITQKDPRHRAVATSDSLSSPRNAHIHPRVSIRPACSKQIQNEVGQQTARWNRVHRREFLRAFPRPLLRSTELTIGLTNLVPSVARRTPECDQDGKRNAVRSYRSGGTQTGRADRGGRPPWTDRHRSCRWNDTLGSSSASRRSPSSRTAKNRRKLRDQRSPTAAVHR